MKNRTVIGIICIALALVLSFGVAPLITRLTDGSIEVVRIKSGQTIDSGTEITEDKIEAFKGKKSDFSDGTYYTMQTFRKKFLEYGGTDYVGKAYAKCQLTAGEYISQAKVAVNGADSGSVFDGLSYDQMAVSVEIKSFADGLSGKLENGDIVSVIVNSGDEGGHIPDELRFVKVITTTTSNGIDRDEISKNEDGSYSATVSTVTLLVSERQAQVLVGCKGDATLALRCRGTSSMAESYLEEQQKIIDEIAVGG